MRTAGCTTVRGAVNLERLVDSDDAGDISIVVNGSKPIRVVSLVLRDQIPYFASMFEQSCVEAQERNIEFEFAVAEREHFVSILRWAHGGTLSVDTHSLGPLYEVARHLQVRAATAQLRDVALRSIRTAAQLAEARITDAELLTAVAHKVPIGPADSLKIFRWALMRSARAVAAQAAGVLPPADALQIVTHIPEGDPLKHAVCDAAAQRLTLASSSSSRSAWLSVLSVSAGQALVGISALLASVPGAVLYRLGSAPPPQAAAPSPQAAAPSPQAAAPPPQPPQPPQPERAAAAAGPRQGGGPPLGPLISVGHCSGTKRSSVVDQSTLYSLLGSDELWVRESTVLDFVCRLLQLVPPEEAAAMRQRLSECVRFGLVPIDRIAAARPHVDDSLLCGVLLAHLGYGEREPSQTRPRLPTARAVLCIAGTLACFAVYRLPALFARGKLAVCIPDLYNGKDALQRWWPVTITAVNADGTSAALVHDSVSSPQWSRVLHAHLRLMGVRRAASPQRRQRRGKSSRGAG
eukprot:TRINITY_DN12227_c0_g1_i1.p1 TRINITY_DN12227_c0_g1~~TRINITY_DN12227_c0_g1_i1.p1  ORF type:complete len:521 (+),score=115.62 TRINITY_DN12227_c0_g1_i1:95-1657(+)